MFKRLSSALLTAALVAVADPAIIWSKPPDLPVDTKVTCKDASVITLDTVLEGRAFSRTQEAEALPMPAEENGDDDMGKIRLEVGDLVIDLTDVVNSWNRDWAPWLNDWVKDNIGDPDELLQAANDCIETLGRTLGSFLGIGPQANDVPVPGTTFDAASGSGTCASADVGDQSLPCPLSTSVDPKVRYARCAVRKAGFTFADYEPATASVPPQATCHQGAQSCEEAAQEKVHNEHSAQVLMEIGKKCQSRGDAAMARNCFEEVQKLVPGTTLAHQAHACMKTVSRLQDSTEACEMRDLIRESPVDVHRINESKRMFNLAEKYAKAGDYDNAYLCYAEACTICPACLSGQKAAKELGRLDAAKAAERRESGIEEQEPPIDRSRAMSDSEWQSREEAHHLYQLGEHCRVGGDRRMALDFYREAHEVSPNCYYGQRALQRIEKN